MFCALSHFLDRHVHWSESSSSSTNQQSGSTSSSRSPFSEIKRRFWESSNHGIVDNNVPAPSISTSSTSSNNNSDVVDNLARPTSENNNDNKFRNTAATNVDNGNDENDIDNNSTSSTNSNSNSSSCVNSPPSSPHRHNRKHLPVPSGPHTVGCVDIMCDVDDHGSFFRLFYPTQTTDIHRHYKQWPLWLPRKQYVHGYLYFLKRNKKIFSRLANLVAGDLYLPVLWQAPLLRSNDKFPVVIVSHGLGGNRTVMSTYCYELASHGFVVVSSEHRDGSASMTLCLQDGLPSILREDNDNEGGSNVDSGHPSSPNHHHHQRNRPRRHHHPYLRFFHTPHHNNNNSPSSSNRPLSSHSASHDDNCDISSLGDSAVQFYLDEGKESRDGHGGRGLRVRQRRQNRRRSLRHNHSCSEEWRPFNHIIQWDDFDYRNGQMYHRVDENSDLLDELIHMNEGADINNALGISFRTSQFKDRLDFSRVALIGHSFGGAAMLATLATDDRFKVGISMDGWLHPVDEWVDRACQQPVLFFNMEHFQWERNVNRMIKFQQTHKHLDRPMLTLLGACHQSISDFQFMLPTILGRFMEMCSTLRPELCMSACVNTTVAFLHKHFDLKMESKHEAILKGNHPNLIVGTNVDLTVPDDGPQPPDRITNSVREEHRKLDRLQESLGYTYLRK